MDSADIKFHLEVFDGPLDLLLHLIKTNELEISEISISQITSQYLDTLRLMESMDLEVAGDYLVMAATLINIKLRALLPTPEEEVEPEGEDLDDFMSAKLLMQRLIEYRKFKEAAQRLGRQAERRAQVFMREVALPKLSAAEADDELRGDLDLLLGAFARVIRFVDRRDYHQVQSEEYTIEQKIAMLRRFSVVEDRIHLTRIFEECHEKVEAIVTLIAVLELCRLKEMRVVQGDCFDEVLLLPRRQNADETEAELARQAAEAEQAEAQIASERTGVLDDGELGEDDDAEVDALLADVVEAPAGRPAPEDEDEGREAGGAEGARIIEIGFGEEREDEGSEGEGEQPLDATVSRADDDGAPEDPER